MTMTKTMTKTKTMTTFMRTILILFSCYMLCLVQVQVHVVHAGLIPSLSGLGSMSGRMDDAAALLASPRGASVGGGNIAAFRPPPLDMVALRRSTESLRNGLSSPSRATAAEMQSALEAMRSQRRTLGGAGGGGSSSMPPLSPPLMPERPPGPVNFLHSAAPESPAAAAAAAARTAAAARNTLNAHISAPRGSGGIGPSSSGKPPLPPSPNLKMAAAKALRSSPHSDIRPFPAEEIEAAAGSGHTSLASPRTPRQPELLSSPRRGPPPLSTRPGSSSPRGVAMRSPRGGSSSLTPRGGSSSLTPRGGRSSPRPPRPGSPSDLMPSPRGGSTMSSPRTPGKRLTFANTADGKTVVAVKPRLTIAKPNAEKAAKSAAFKAAQADRKAKIAKLVEPPIRKLDAEVQSLVRSEKYFDAYKRLHWDTERTKFLEAAKSTFAKNPDKALIMKELQEQMNQLKKKFADLEVRNHAAINQRDPSKYWIDTHFRDSAAEKLKAVKTFMREYRGGKDIAIITGGQNFKSNLAKSFPAVQLRQLGTRDAFQVLNRNDFLHALGM